MALWSRISGAVGALALVVSDGRVSAARRLDSGLRDRPPTVLFVRLDAVGDFVLWARGAAGVVRDLRARGFRVVLVGNEAWADLAAALLDLDEFLGVDRARFWSDRHYRLGTLRKVRAFRPVRAFNLSYSRELHFGDAVIRACGARERVGWSGDLVNVGRVGKWIGDHFYTRLVSDPTACTEIARNARLAAEIAGGDLDDGFPLLDVSRLPADRGAPGDYFVVFPGAGADLRRWPPDRFGAVGRRIQEETGWAGVLCGGRGDRVAAAAVRQTWSGAVDLVGQTDLPRLAAILHRARLVLTNETSAAHIAAAVGTRSVCILGGGHFGRFLPYGREVPAGPSVPVSVFQVMPCYGCNWKCRYSPLPGSPAPCIEAVDVDAVVERVRGILHQDAGSSPRGDEAQRSDVPALGGGAG